MKVEKLPIDSVKPSGRNAKIHTEEQIGHIINSIERFGFNDPIGICGEQNIIVEGHGRWLAQKRRGETEIECIRLDHLTEDERRAYTLIHNQTTLETRFDIDALRFELGDICGVDFSKFADLSAGIPSFTVAEDIGQDFQGVFADEEVQDVIARIEGEKEYSPEVVGKAQKLRSQVITALDYIIASEPEKMSHALCMVVPTGRSSCRDLVVITDPKLGDIATELRRYAEGGETSPCAALLEGLVSYAPDIGPD